MSKKRMSNYKFEEFLNEKFNGDPNAVLKGYQYADPTDIFSRIKETEKSDADGLKSIANEIVLWKLNRMIFVDESVLGELKDLSDIKTAEDVVSQEEKRKKIEKLLKRLLTSKGLKLAMASTFLHFFNPDVFPILDQRAYRVIFEEDYKQPTSVENQVETYFAYLDGCIKYYNAKLQGKIDFSKIDQYLYQLDKEIGNGVKM